MMSDILETFARDCPVAVMARLGLERAISANWVDSVFEQHRGQQYTRELLFSTVVDKMSLVVLGLRPSLHAAIQKQKVDMPVSQTAFYDKVNHTEPAVLKALVRGSAERLTPVVNELHTHSEPLVSGYQVRIVDGNHLPRSEKRLGPLRGFRGAALPGFSLVVYDPDLDLVTDLWPCEDAHTQERIVAAQLFAGARPGELWLGDRNFCTRAVMTSLDKRGAAFLLREHGVTNPTPVGPRREVGRVETGAVFEQAVEIPTAQDGLLRLRRIEVVLDAPTEDGDTVIRLLTNLPNEIDALTIARLYRRRWQVEGLFGRLEGALNSEIAALGRPRAALLAFATAVVAYNVLSIIQAAIAATHDLKSANVELSTYQIADDVKAYYAGMMVALRSDPSLRELAELEARPFAHSLCQIASYVTPKSLQKHPRKPKIKKCLGYAPSATVKRHVATARVLRDGAIIERPCT